MLFSEESQKAAQFIQLANQSDTPLLFLQNTTGYMVGKEYEQGGIIKHGAMMINAVSNSTVPHLTVNLGASYGAGNYGMCGRAYEPRFLFTWPNAKSAVMGPAQLAGVMSIVARAAAEAQGQAFDEEADAAMLVRWSRSRSRPSPADVPLRAALRRRGHRPPRHPHRPGHLPVRHREPALDRRRRLRRLPNVSAPMINRLLVANRAEIASRVFRTCRALGIETVAVHSDADAALPYVAEADAAVRLPGNAPGETYLRADLVLEAARAAGADAIHPGYGFLSENADFARAVEAAGLTWVGPAPASIEQMGSKIESKKLMEAAGVPVLTDHTVETATEADLPVLVKASAGGGGRGMRIVRDLADLAERASRRAAEAAVGVRRRHGLRRALRRRGRHVEVQVLGDTPGHGLDLGERDCSIQRRHQKVVEECPSPAVDPGTRYGSGSPRPRWPPEPRGRLRRRRHRRVPARRDDRRASSSSWR